MSTKSQAAKQQRLARKPRDSRHPMAPQGLSAQPEKVQAQLRAWLLTPGLPYRRVVELMQSTYGIRTSDTSLLRYMCAHKLRVPGGAPVKMDASTRRHLTGAGCEITIHAPGAREIRVELHPIPSNGPRLAAAKQLAR